MIAGIFFLWIWASMALGRAVPPVLADLSKPKLDQIDRSKVYEPNPPATNSVLMVLEYFDEDQGKPVEHEMTMELYGTVAPKTTRNFQSLARGVKIRYDGQSEEQFQQVSYKDTLFHHVEPGKLIQGGDILEDHIPFSIYGNSWPAENFDLKHDRPGRLCMANNGPEDQNSQFFITTGMQGEPDFDGKYVVFGQVVAGLDKLIQKIQYTPLGVGGKPIHNVKLKYVLAYDLAIMDNVAQHNAYLKKLEDYRNGDVSKGVTMGLTLAEGEKEEKQLNDIMFNDLHHPLTKVLIGVFVLLLVYLVVRHKRVPKALRRV
ncbi:ZYRO0D08294p [Zygosaccharomyces rouxii]|uniref:ZYRO0D08294p n=2 Tax=Zygosaccharomyces rouxii TaxID=4956 RepID=C5DVP2_ZYGRC|nr:uncharacterized protein ZYRO0D08294g [Zygosaccharomyces rouxii]KAH9200773.1 peptidyl-prolyl cis-trans isomerase [Zygosaccharomyces rouxii]CAQ43596.1 Peptidyl-prolyl cis-trans isomerase CPR4 and Peptidyl-prolyl cis-trans isomerase CYP8 [Zygosaccharomyces rouxii]CAR27861.1 ZYRO0D08294p [Zygosaccharomyces rouxii]